MPPSDTPPAHLEVLPPAGHILYQLPSRMSPHRAELEDLILWWADQHNLVCGPQARQRLTDTHLGELIARCYPHLRADRLAPLAGWFTWAFVIDDLHDSRTWPNVAGHTLITIRMLAALSPQFGGRSPVVDAPPLAATLAAVWLQVAGQQSPQWQLRFITHMGHFLDAFAYEAFNRLQQHTPALSGYTQLRRASGGITPALDLLEYSAGLEVPPLLHETEQLRTMFNKAADVVVWVNDVLSLPKELAIDEVTNGVLVLSHTFGCGTQDAIDLTYRRVADDIRTFLCTEEELLALCSTWRGLEENDHTAIITFIEGMKAWMRGNLEWATNSHRYLTVDTMRLANNFALIESENIQLSE